jgi:2-amino-4-hydroxy-6-hydroxymethyldihydropteridine diphosphokinase
LDSRVFLSLGSNLGDRKKNLQRACLELKKYLIIEKVSGIYQTEPLHFVEQDAFYNCGLKAGCSLEPLKLLEKAKEIENRMGRVESIRYGPRVIDIDIIFWEKQGKFISIKNENLIVPHPMWDKRKFVIKTMMELNTEKWINAYIEENNIDISKLNQEIIYVSDLNI